MFTVDKVTLEDVGKFIAYVIHNKKTNYDIYELLSDKGIPSNLYYMNADTELTDEQKREFMLIKIKYS